ncbi:MAG: helix-turn-helix transcriptional regulator [Gammaproteobacteria bacterium]|uniref:helix-turn-helix transcriptional regulator n=1 Tax=Halomonas sp. R57-5 TaxID=1610576 RepID=UPI00054D914D|nr:helix-turn-helix transcriptional regulator [Halomonas sp. R57-5]MBR9905805.1 helix-turn-helix transcriptional regulator [Gammaproteobacteria bacterium]CEP37925.1 LuxR family transcriptional regulator [Halomonas sp. R57-5]
MERVTHSEHDEELANAIMALATPELPQYFSSLVKCLAAFDNLIIIAYHGEHRPAVLYREYTDPVVYLPMDSQYLGGAYLLDPFYREHLRGSVQGIRRLMDVAPDHFRRTHYYKNYYQQTTLLDEVAVFASITESVTLTACLGRDCSSGKPFNKRELQALRQYGMTLSSLLKKHWQDYRSDNVMKAAPAPVEERLREALNQQHSIRLSPRQAEVALFILRGHSSLSISLHLGVSLQTVKVFRRQLYAKCCISSQAELFALLMPLFARLTEHG